MVFVKPAMMMAVPAVLELEQENAPLVKQIII